MSRARAEGSRLFMEGAVIVVSILLAFAIDAWWEERQEAEEAGLQIERVVAELKANVALLEEQIESLGTTTGAAKRLLSKFGPDPQPVTRTEVATLFDDLYASGTIALNRSASQSFLSSGIFTRGDWLAVRHALSELLSYQDVSEKRSIELREMRPAINQLIARQISILDTALTHELMADYSPSRFPYDPSVMFSDMRVEGLVADYAIRMEINRSGHTRLLETHRALLDQIEKTRAPR